MKKNKELIKKLRKEFDDLKNKTDKLWLFIYEGKEIYNVPYMEQNLLSTQYNLMVSYGNILLARINLLENKNGTKE